MRPPSTMRPNRVRCADAYFCPCAHCHSRFGRPRFRPRRRAEAAPSDPTGFVASIYAYGREPAVWVQWLDGARRGEWFSHAVTALWAECDADARKTHDELGPLDFDVATNSQGLTVKGFTSRRSRETPGMRASSRSSRPIIGSVNRSARTRSATTSSGSADAWAIDDVHSVIEPKPWSLRALLTQYLAQ